MVDENGVSEEDLEISPGLVEKYLQEALRKNQQGKKTDPYVCPACGRWTQNAPYMSVCLACLEAGNYASDPSIIVARAMHWVMGWPVDLIDTLSKAEEHSEADLVKIAQSPGGEDELARLWDKATYAADHLVEYGYQTIENPRNPTGNSESRLVWEQIPEENRTYRSRPRPQTNKERVAGDVKQKAFYDVQDRERIREAAKRAAVKQLEQALNAAKDAGADVADFSLVCGDEFPDTKEDQ